MNSNAHTTSRFAALSFAAVMTLVTLLGVGQLADQSHAQVQITQTSGESVKA
ncbi:MAG: hypothetical protein H7Z19_04585 [Chitinophagaceae bacterium]|nr:hypothetical protein [Rubrivivax sp.]